MSYKEVWQGFYETAQESGMCDEDAGQEASAMLAESYADRIDQARDEAKDRMLEEDNR